MPAAKAAKVARAARRHHGHLRPSALAVARTHQAMDRLRHRHRHRRRLPLGLGLGLGLHLGLVQNQGQVQVQGHALVQIQIQVQGQGQGPGSGLEAPAGGGMQAQPCLPSSRLPQRSVPLFSECGSHGSTQSGLTTTRSGSRPRRRRCGLGTPTPTAAQAQPVQKSTTTAAGDPSTAVPLRPAAPGRPWPTPSPSRLRVRAAAMRRQSEARAPARGRGGQSHGLTVTPQLMAAAQAVRRIRVVVATLINTRSASASSNRLRPTLPGRRGRGDAISTAAMRVAIPAPAATVTGRLSGELVSPCSVPAVKDLLNALRVRGRATAISILWQPSCLGVSASTYSLQLRNGRGVQINSRRHGGIAAAAARMARRDRRELPCSAESLQPHRAHSTAQHNRLNDDVLGAARPITGRRR